MAGNRLFAPGDQLSIRGPLDNNRDNGSIVNTPRFSQNGGLNSADKTGLYRNNAGVYKNAMTIHPPGGTLRRVPMGPGANPMAGSGR